MWWSCNLLGMNWTRCQFTRSTNIIKRQQILVMCVMVKTSSWDYIYFLLKSTLWAYFFNENFLSYLYYLHCVYKMTFYIKICHFSWKTSIVWHFMPKCHIIEYTIHIICHSGNTTLRLYDTFLHHQWAISKRFVAD